MFESIKNGAPMVLAVACVMALAAPLPVVAQLTEVVVVPGQQCRGIGINNQAFVVGACADTDGTTLAFLATGAQKSILPGLALGRSCSAGVITNLGKIVGSCVDSNLVSQAVVWNTGGSPIAQRLMPLPNGKSTSATAFNQEGVVAGVSRDGSFLAQPAVWLNSATATALPVGLLGLSDTNCVPVDVSDGSSSGPTVIANCPDRSGGFGRSIGLARVFSTHTSRRRCRSHWRRSGVVSRRSRDRMFWEYVTSATERVIERSCGRTLDRPSC